MNIIDWLKQGNSNITYMVEKHLEEKDVIQKNDGYIEMYLSKYVSTNKMWGNGLYSPKWISSTYTLLDLVNLEADVDSKMIEGYIELRENIAVKYTLNPQDEKTLDLCIVGMLLKIGSYINVEVNSHKELIDYILYTINDDGAWNCFFNYRKYKTSSLHTTINILEGLAIYKEKGYTYRIEEVVNAMHSADEFILKKQLFRSRRTNEIINKEFTKLHYPCRWRYDIYRAMEYFVNVNKPYDKRMNETMTYIEKYLSKGSTPKGGTYPGKTHFNLELDDYKRINTLRLLEIVKFYDNDFYLKIIA